ncbi:GrpB family protein [Lysinibacillus fusiformis]|uniref:GrpB family protein n=1 Tax=Lysinibacillus fusiformis TaxID=28031 RepID=UPI003CEA82F8
MFRRKYFAKTSFSLYDEQWLQLFMEEAEKLNFIFRNEIIGIYHIGSNSVPGLKAKPVIHSCERLFC